VEFDDRRRYDAVYLHYLDRELNIAAGHLIPGAEAVRVTRLLALLTQAELYCGLSAIWENDGLDSRALEDFEALFRTQQLQPVSRDLTTAEFLRSRREAYAHDESRYPGYFTDKAERLGWSHPRWQKKDGSTKSLEHYLQRWSEVLPPPGRYIPSALAAQKPIREALAQREGQAITYALFAPRLGDLADSPQAQYTIRRRISTGFTEDYLRHGEGTVATGIQDLAVFDELSTDFPFYDVRLLGELAGVIGLNVITDYLSTSLITWEKYLVARNSVAIQLLAGTVRWILAALHAREQARQPRLGDDAPRFHSRQPVRNRMVSAIREAARVTERLIPPARGQPPEEAAQRAQGRLLWLADRLGELDPLIKAYLDDSRRLISMPNIDVVLVTVNDIETDEVTATLEGAGYRARIEIGPVNTYWVYGPVGNAVVAHVRSGMGSSGQGGSALTTIDAIRDLHPGAILGVGVAFGIDPDEQPIGQLLLSERLTEYERAKIGVGPSGQTIVLNRGASAEASPRLVGRFRDARLSSLGIDVRAGEMLSGEKLIDNPYFKSALLNRFPEAIGGEMEGAGVQAASGREGTEWLVVKAVCDYANEKNFDRTRRQKLAASQAAKAVLRVLELGGLKRKSV
jgi:nucleoside phosphorylase